MIDYIFQKHIYIDRICDPFPPSRMRTRMIPEILKPKNRIV